MRPGRQNAGGSQKNATAYCWAMLLARIYECLPLCCPRCGRPMTIIAFITAPPTIEKILAHIGEPTAPPPILPARGPPQAEFEFDQTAGTKGWPEIDQTTGHGGDSWD